METIYEFVVETLFFYDGCGDNPDITDTISFPTLRQAIRYANACCYDWRIALRRDTYDETGVIYRYYAYPTKDGYLPDYMETATGFNDGPNVPKRFRHVELPLTAKG